MARQPVRITDLSTDTVEVRDTTPTSTAMGLVVRVASQNVSTSPTSLDASYAEDSPHVSGSTGVFVLAVQTSTEGSLVNANLDYAPLQVDSSGNLRTRISDAQLLGEPILVEIHPSTWTVVVESTNATATATRAAPIGAGQRHYITSIAGSFSPTPVDGKRLELKQNATVKYSVFAADPIKITFASPIRFTTGTTATLTLAAGGVGSVGIISMVGYTRAT